MKKWTMIIAGVALALTLTAGNAAAKKYKITVSAGHPPVFLWVTLCRDFFIPEIDKRLAALHNVTYMTPFATGNLYHVVDTITELQGQIPALAREWTKHNQIYLGGAALDNYGILTSFPVKSVDDVNGQKIAAPGPSANGLKGTGGGPVASNWNEYYNGIRTGGSK